MRSTTRGLALAALLLAGCGSPQGEQTADLEGIDSLGEDPAGLYEPGADVVGDEAEAEPPTERRPDEGEALHPTPESGENGPPDWTLGRVDAAPTVRDGAVRVTGVRSGRHTDFDRLVIDLGGPGGGLPGYRVEYVDRPLHECGSGRQVQPVGDGWLQVRIEPAAAHTEEGRTTVPPESFDPGLPGVLRVYRTCDFEGVVELVLAVPSPQPFRAFDLSQPRRIVVDVRHDARTPD